MEWADEGIVLGVRRHGESSAIVELLTRGHGRASAVRRWRRIRHAALPRARCLRPPIPWFRVYRIPPDHAAVATANHPLNQPCASPVKEKYSPAAVSAQETISMALSSSTPLEPIVCASEMTDSTSEASSTQRGQFFRRRAARPTKYTINRIRPAAITVAAAIVDPETSALGVRSWNATDSASSVSDRYSKTSNHSTFLGTVIGTPVIPLLLF